MIRVTVWNEGVHEVESPEIAAVYPHGIHGQIKSFLDTQEDIEVRTATLNDPDCGLPPEVLESTALRAFFKALQAPYGHLLRPALARRRF